MAVHRSRPSERFPIQDDWSHSRRCESQIIWNVWHEFVISGISPCQHRKRAVNNGLRRASAAWSVLTAPFSVPVRSTEVSLRLRVWCLQWQPPQERGHHPSNWCRKACKGSFRRAGL